MAEFATVRNRDAWFVIRGYVYQVENTVIRWLGLASGEVLELERGEDIDRILPMLASGEAERLLEQIKLRNVSITLRSATAVEAIANALEHKDQNPQLRMRFHFTTNARAGRERPSPLRKGSTGIGTWEKIRLGTLGLSETDEALTGILAILKSVVTRPEQLNRATWDRFVAFMASASTADLITIIRAFAWNTDEPDQPDLKPAIKQSLLTRGHATTDDQAERIYNHLFAVVFRALCEPGVKRLTIEDRHAHLRIQTEDPADGQLLQCIRRTVLETSERVGRLEQDQQRMAASVDILRQSLQALSNSQGLTAAITHVIETPVLEVPPAVQAGSDRIETVTAIAGRFETTPFLALHGGAGTGKTQLAVNLAHRIGCPLWVSFRDLDVVQSCQRLDAAIATIGRASRTETLRDTLKYVARNYPAYSVVILDDLPRIFNDDPFATRLIAVSQACELENLYLLTTSTSVFPTGLRSLLNVSAIDVPLEFPLTEQEATEILAAFSAPLSCQNEKFVRFALSLVHKNPTLFAALVKYLRDHDWDNSNRAFGDLLAGGYAIELNEETIRRVVSTVSLPESRDLLYRLTLILGSFDRSIVERLAAVAPVLDRPNERLSEITGLWVQRESSVLLSVSPLVRTVGPGDVPPDTRRGCYDVLGDSIASRPHLTEGDVAEAISYFTLAESFERAAYLLVLGLSELNRQDTIRDHTGLVSFWWDVNLPSQMQLKTQLLVRSWQVAVGSRMDRKLDQVVNDLVRLVDLAGEEERIGIIATAVLAVHVVALHDFGAACRIVGRALRFLDPFNSPPEEAFEFPPGTGPGMLPWFIITAADTVEKLDQWLDMIETLPGGLRTLVFDNQIGLEGCLNFANRLYSLEDKKEPSQQDWLRILTAASSFADRARALGLGLLSDCFVRTSVIVNAEYLHDLAGAQETADRALSAINTEAGRFLLLETMGRNYHYVGREAEATDYLSSALDCNTTEFPLEHMAVNLHLERLSIERSPSEALAYAKTAAELAEANPTSIPVGEAVRTLLELSIAAWRAGDWVAVFEALDVAFAKLLAQDKQDETWKALVARSGHVLGYLTSMVTTGEPPAATGDGVPYVAPQPGMLLNRDLDITNYFTPVGEANILVLLASFAEAVGCEERASELALQGYDSAKQTKQSSAATVVSQAVITHLILAGRFGEVVDIGLDVGAMAVATQKMLSEGAVPPLVGFEPEELLGEKPSEAWDLAESWGAFASLCPSVVQLARWTVSGPIKASEEARSIVELCKLIAMSASHRTLWSSAARLIDLTFCKRIGYRGMQAELDLIPQDQTVLRAIATIGVSIQTDTSVANSLAQHLSVFPFMSDRFKREPSVLRKIVSPFIRDYWISAFETRRIHFSTPALVEKALHDAIETPIDVQAQAILRAVSTGLNVRIPDNINKWLAGRI